MVVDTNRVTQPQVISHALRKVKAARCRGHLVFPEAGTKNGKAAREQMGGGQRRMPREYSWIQEHVFSIKLSCYR